MNATNAKFETVAAVIERLSGRRPTPATVCRFVLKGSYGVRLRTSMIGCRRVTTEAWVREWMEAVSERTTPSATAKAENVSPGKEGQKRGRPSRVHSQAEDIDRQLDEAGV